MRLSYPRISFTCHNQVVCNKQVLTCVQNYASPVCIVFNSFACHPIFLKVTCLQKVSSFRYRSYTPDMRRAVVKDYGLIKPPRVLWHGPISWHSRVIFFFVFIRKSTATAGFFPRHGNLFGEWKKLSNNCTASWALTFPCTLSVSFLTQVRSGEVQPKRHGGRWRTLRKYFL